MDGCLAPELTGLVVRTYEGDLCNGAYHGEGRVVFANGSIYRVRGEAHISRTQAPTHHAPLPHTGHV
jgi:hypothetical protein